MKDNINSGWHSLRLKKFSSEIENTYNEELRPLLTQLQEANKKTRALIERAKNKNLYSENGSIPLEDCHSEKGYFYHFEGCFLDDAMRREAVFIYEKKILLINAIKKKDLEIQRRFRFYSKNNTQIPLPPVMLLDSALNMADFATAKVSMPHLLKNQLLYLQIDLTADSKAIKDQLELIIDTAQKQTGKRKPGVRETAKRKAKTETLMKIFLNYYVNAGLSKRKALEKTVDDLEKEGFTGLNSDSIERAYFPKIKALLGVQDIRELKRVTKS